MLSSRTGTRPTTAVAVVCAVAVALVVAVGGELSPAAHVAVLGSGAVVAGAGLVRRAGAGAPARRRPASGWLVPAALALAWEAVALVDGRLPTVSDVLDPVLAVPAVRAAATLAWLAVGARLATRPGPAAGAAMRTPAGRVLVLAAWLWAGVHFLAR